MPYKITGPLCARSGCGKPPYLDGVCWGHYALSRAVGRTSDEEPAEEPAASTRKLGSAQLRLAATSLRMDATQNPGMARDLETVAQFCEHVAKQLEQEAA